jgi:hypothetical protein
MLTPLQVVIIIGLFAIIVVLLFWDPKPPRGPK